MLQSFVSGCCMSLCESTQSTRNTVGQMDVWVKRPQFLSQSASQEKFEQYSVLFHIGNSLFIHVLDVGRNIRGTKREYSSKPLKHSIAKRMLVFKR